VVGEYLLEDHAYFDVAIIQTKMHASQATSILVTQKDWVKLQNSGIELSIMTLHLEIDTGTLDAIDGYISI